MQLHSPAFEKSLHTAARVQLRKSPEKWRAYLWTYLWNPPAWAVLALLVGLPFVLMFCLVIKPVLNDPPFPSLVAMKTRLITDMVLTYTVGVCFLQWVSLKLALQAPAQRLPVSQRLLFEGCAANHRNGLLFFALALGFAGTVVTWIHQGELLWQNALLFGLVHTLNAYVLGLAWVCWLASLPPKPFKPPSMVRGLLTCGIIFGPFWLTVFWNGVNSLCEILRFRGVLLGLSGLPVRRVCWGSAMIR